MAKVKCPSCGHKRILVGDGERPWEDLVCGNCRRRDVERKWAVGYEAPSDDYQVRYPQLRPYHELPF
jgi:hypothetical protein